MFSVIRKRLTYANVAMTLAFVFAMTGGAYAASKYLITSTKQISPKVLKALQGKAGPAGAQGPAGAAGAQGPAGAAGAAGKDGANGVSVTSSKEPAGVNCKAGGSKFVSANGTTYVCNGENGQTGFTDVLPEGKTETGTWGFSVHAEGLYVEPLSFPIPLAAPLVEGKAHFVTAAEVEGHTAPAECPGSAAAPSALEGNLCVYARAAPSGSVEFFEFQKNPPPGGVIAFFAITEEPAGPYGAAIAGSWAVTAS